MAGAFTHRWQGQTLGSLPRAELLEVAAMLADLLDAVTGQRPDGADRLDALTLPELHLLIWRADLRLEPHRPLALGGRKAPASPTPSASTSSKSASDTKTTPPRDTAERGGLIDLWAE